MSDVAGFVFYGKVGINTTTNDTAFVEPEIVKAEVEISFVNDVQSECKPHGLKVSIERGAAESDKYKRILMQQTNMNPAKF